jgi:hypothetical protein
MINENVLEEKLAALEKTRHWSPRVISKLEAAARSGDDFSLFRVNPLQFGAAETVEVDAGPGMLVGLDRLNWSEFHISVADGGASSVAVRLANGNFEPKQSQARPGAVRLEIKNEAPRKAAIAVMHFAPDYKSTPVQFDPFLSGKRLLTTQTFRDLFQTETTKGTDGLGVKDITVLFTDLKGSTDLYDRIGDLKAFSLVQQHFDRLARVIKSRDGATIKTIGDAIMASFLRPSDAVEAALLMQKEIEGFNAKYGQRELVLKIGIHKGASIVVTLNDRLDLFGQTVNIASRVQGLAGADEIFVTQDEMRVYKIRGRVPAAP